jgi:hypothetical protein
MDLAQDGLSFFSVAMIYAGSHKEYEALNFYLQQKIIKLGRPMLVLADVVEHCVSDRSLAYFFEGKIDRPELFSDSTFFAHYCHGCIHAMKELISKHAAMPTAEMIKKIQQSDLNPTLKTLVLHALQNTLGPYSRMLIHAGSTRETEVELLNLHIIERIKALGGSTEVLEAVVEHCVSTTNLAEDAENYYRGCAYVIKELICKYGAKSSVEMAGKITNSGIPDVWKETMKQTLRLAAGFNPFEISAAMQRLSEMLAHPTQGTENVNDLIKKIGRSVTLLSQAEKKALCRCALTRESYLFLSEVSDEFRALIDRAILVKRVVQQNTLNLPPENTDVSAPFVDSSQSRVEATPRPKQII